MNGDATVDVLAKHLKRCRYNHVAGKILVNFKLHNQLNLVWSGLV